LEICEKYKIQGLIETTGNVFNPCLI